MLNKEFVRIIAERKSLRGYSPQASWYLAWVLPGQMSEARDGIMLIDLCREHSSCERIIRIWPHQLMHQIMIRENNYVGTTAIAPIIGEEKALSFGSIRCSGKASILCPVTFAIQIWSPRFVKRTPQRA